MKVYFIKGTRHIVDVISSDRDDVEEYEYEGVTAPLYLLESDLNEDGTITSPCPLSVKTYIASLLRNKDKIDNYNK